MRIFYRVQADYEAGRITTRPEDLPGAKTLPPPPLTPEQKRKLREEVDKFFSKGLIIITTQEQYDALPSGTRYRDKNGAIGTKR